MATTLDFSKFTFSPEEVRAISELVMDNILEAPEIDYLHTVFPNIVTDKEIGFVGESGLVGVKNQGCNPIPQDWSIATRAIRWTPEEWEILLHECWKDLKPTAAVYSINKGKDMADFSNTDYMALVAEVLTRAMKKFIIRFAWFNDTDAKNIADGGIITNNVDTKYFNLIDGFWKQLSAQITANPAQRVAIAENTGADYLAQKLNPANVQNYLEDLVFNATINLKSQDNGVIYCTQSIYDAYAKSLKGTGLESMYINLTNGNKTLSYDGKPLIAIPVWDEMIMNFENNGTKLNNPHRALYTTKDILGLGVDDPNAFGDLNIWYDKDTRKVKIEAMGTADAKILNPDLFQLAI